MNRDPNARDHAYYAKRCKAEVEGLEARILYHQKRVEIEEPPEQKPKPRGRKRKPQRR